MISRESTVAALAALMLVFTGWAWGGVVLWTQFATCALGAVALIAALMPRDRTSPLMASARRQLGFAAAFGLLVAAAFIGWDLSQLSQQRAATVELVPDATLPAIGFADWGLRGLLAGLGAMLASMIAIGLRTPTNARSTLLRFPPFWIGVALFSYIAVQSVNPWGVVVERDLTWNILPQDHISWLPAGLAAPFIGDRDPGGMNGWRQMLILSGPWMLLCALRIGVSHRRTYARLAWIVGINALAIAVVGNVAYASKQKEFLGYAPSWPSGCVLFGPFVNRNHAGIYFYLSAALALALAAQLVIRRGDKADRGGPHLIAAMLAVMLCFAAASTVSMGCILVAAGLLLAAPVLYFLDPRLRTALSPAPAIMLLVLSLGLGSVVVKSTNLGLYRYRMNQKIALLEQGGRDDRAPMRQAGLDQIGDGGGAKFAYGWGAGSYRWVSPPYFARQPEFLDSRGRLQTRSNFAHCDWLQAFLEWGLVGAALVGAAGFWLALGIRNAWRRRSAPLLALSAAFVAVTAHATFDLIFYFTPALSLLALMVAWFVVAEDAAAVGSAG